MFHKLKDNFMELLWLFYYRLVLIRKADKAHRNVICKIRDKGFANVVLFASNLPMWRYQGVYELLTRDKRFKTTIILAPFLTLSKEQNDNNIEKLKTYFDSKGISYLDASGWDNNQCDINGSLNPDLLFYTQPYGVIYGNMLDSIYYEDKLLCYIPYWTGISIDKWALNTKFQNVAWKLFYDNIVMKKVARKFAYNGARNVYVVGNSYADIFLKQNHKDVWKKQEKRHKRIIWAPHFTIESKQLVHRGGFLWLCDEMLKIAYDYKDSIQIAFKPHPRLKSILYKDEIWGKQKTDAYYDKWDELDNGQLEEADYIDLFMTSDAMIHDSSSFMTEYHYTKNPVMFTTNSLKDVLSNLNDFGKEAIEAHYLGSSVADVRRFVLDVVLGGKDNMKEIRSSFYNKYLMPPNGRTVAENVYSEIIKSIWG